MTQLEFLRSMDVTFQDTFMRTGLADDAVFSPDGISTFPCRVFVDRGLTTASADNSRFTTDQITITAFLAEIVTVPKRGSTFFIGIETFTVDAVQNADESRAVCLVKPGL